MDSEVELTARAKYDLRRMSPSDQIEAAGALDMLADDDTRGEFKVDLYDEDEFGFKVWGFVPSTTFITFVELEGKIKVTHIAGQSRFRPPLRPL